MSILFILSKNQLLVLLIFAMVSFVSFAFFSALIFKISFFLLTLGFSISSFSSCFRCRVRLFILLFSCFLMYACIAINRWQEYREELYKKDLHDLDNHDGVITHKEPDILECGVKWALESINEQS